MLFDKSIYAFLNRYIVEYENIVAIEGDASTRLYYRIFTNTKTYILCRDSQFLHIPYDEYPYGIVYNLFKNFIPVPEVYAVDSNNGLLLIQDLGDNLFEYFYHSLSADDVIKYYSNIIDILVSIQGIRGEGSIPFSLCFDIEKLMFEFNFFIEHALFGFFKASISDTEINDLNQGFYKISERLYRPDLFVLNHRDFHSRNIIISGDSPYIIDFQDARMGLPQYDLVSLLRDSYTRLEDGAYNYLKNYYFDLSSEKDLIIMSRNEFEYYFDIMAFQRNIKAIGTFCYQVSIKNNEKYQKYIEPSLNYIPGYVERHDELKKIWNILKRYVGGNKL